MTNISAMITSVLESNPEIQLSVEDIVKSILIRYKGGRNYFTLSMIRDSLSIESTRNRELFDLLIELSNPKYHFLTMHFNFIDDDGQPVEIAGDHYYEAIVTGVFYDPEKGTPVENYMERIFPFFRLVD